MTPPQKERIIDQAMHMFVSQGIKSVRMDDIAQQLGVSKRTLYEMFGDKEGLLYLAMERYSERNRQRWNELTADAHDVLEAMFMVLGEVMDNAEVSRRMMQPQEVLSRRTRQTDARRDGEKPHEPAFDARTGHRGRAVRQ